MPRRVPTHRPAHQSAASVRGRYERRPERRADDAFYSSATWRRLRASFLLANPLCADCRAAGRLVPAVHVHHRIDRKADPSRSLDWENLQALCAPCHGRKRKHE